LFLYTDGVTEAMNQRSELFSDAKLKRQLEGCEKHTTKETVEQIMGDIAEFASGAEQSDDITILLMRFTHDK
jgi:phosphoserine phosphatase RsbU/P